MQDIKLLNILKSAYAPCKHINGKCAETCRWKPEIGLVPSGFGGARGNLSDVKLVIVAAEPGEPVDNANYNDNPIGMVKNSIRIFDEAMVDKFVTRGQKKIPNFHRSLTEILNFFWNDLDKEEIYRRTWYTNTILCPFLKGEHGVHRSRHLKIVGKNCIKKYLKSQLDLFEKAFVLALGSKARDRMYQNNIDFDVHVYHPSYPISKIKKHQCWKAAASKFHEFLGNNNKELSSKKWI